MIGYLTFASSGMLAILDGLEQCAPSADSPRADLTGAMIYGQAGQYVCCRRRAIG